MTARETPLGRVRPQAGFTMLELMMAMAVFTVLGAAVVILMRQGLTIFGTATRESALQDRMDIVLPQVERNLEILALPASFDAPPPPPPEEERITGEEWTPPPPVDVRLRAGTIVLRDVPEGPLKGQACAYAAWVTDISGVRSDPILRQAGDRPGPDLQDVVPLKRGADAVGAAYKPTGGLREVCYIAIPVDPRHPALLTLYYGWRSPVGGAGSLLDPENLDTLEEIEAACRPVERGLLYFGTTWRRVFATDWTPTKGRVGETEPYVGVRWDSTRALDRSFALFRDPLSLGDPSDDVFPAWVRLEVALSRTRPPPLPEEDESGGTAAEAGERYQGETVLVQGIGAEARELIVEDTRPLLSPGPEERWLKVDGEWMRYRADRVKPRSGLVPVERGLRGTKAASHDADADVFVGLESRRDVRLLFRDRYARSERRQP